MARSTAETRVASREALAPFRTYAQALGVDLAELLEGVPHLVHPPAWIEWTDYVRAHDDLARRLGGADEALLRFADVLTHSPETVRISRAVALFVEPRTYFLKAPLFVIPRLFRHMRVETRREGERVLIEVEYPPSYAPCRALFLLMAGNTKNATTLMGLPPCEVEHEVHGHGMRLTVRPPPSGTLWARGRRALFVVLNSGATYDELVRQERELRATVAENERALAIRDRFLQAMGHEIRTPFNGLLHSVDALRSPGAEDATQELLAAVSTSASRLSIVLESILAYAKLSSESFAGRPSVARPVALLRSEASRLARLAEERGAHVRVEPGEGSEGWALFDEMHLGRAIAELAKNALRFSPPGEEVVLAARVDLGRLEVEIRDRGPGIPPLEREAVLQPFVQGLAGEVRSHGGLGLGLAIVDVTVRGLGGRLSLVDRPGGGLVARIEIPVQIVDPPPRPAASGRRVLVVDDDRINRMVATRLLRKLRCEVTQAENGAEALGRLQAETFDLVLMDCEMPVLDGWRATRALREDLRLPVPVVAATAYAAERDRERCMQAGMDDFLAKPLDPGRLSAILEKWLGPDEGAASAPSAISG